MDCRFEAMALNGALALIRLRSDPSAAPLAQAFTDKLFRALDAGLREAGVGDTSVPKRMRGLASSFYGRLEAYAAPIGGGDEPALAAALSRNVLGAEHPFAATLARHVLSTARAQADAPLSVLLDADGWPSPPP